MEKRTNEKNEHISKNSRTIIDELFPVYASSHISFFGKSLVHADPLQESSSETPDALPGFINTEK